MTRAGRPGVSWALQRYLVLEILKVFLFVLTVIELGYALLVAVVVARRFDLDLLLLLAVPQFWSTALSMLNDSFPLALLFAAGLVYGRLVADRETTALKSFGLSYGQILSPLLLIGLVAGISGFFVNGFVAPAMNYQKNDMGAFLASQLRYLGEGSNREFARGNLSLWVLRYNGRRLEGIFIGPKGEAKAEGLISTEVSEELDPLSLPFYLFAERGEVLTPEDVERQWVAELEKARATPGADVEAVEKRRPRPGTFVFRLLNVRLFLSDEFFNPHDPSDFMHMLRFSSLSLPYDPSTIQRERLPKHLSLWDLRAEIDRARSKYDRNELEAEYHWRWARTWSCFLYPLLAGVVALFLNAENRYLPFFVAVLIGPSAFYGMGTIGQMLAKEGWPAWATTNAGTVVLSGLIAAGWVLLEKKILR